VAILVGAGLLAADLAVDATSLAQPGAAKAARDAGAADPHTAVPPSDADVARRARIEGKVILQAVVDKEGNVNEVTVLSSSNPMFNDSAIEAVKQRKYKPALQNGRPVAIYFTIRVDFRLR